MLKKLIIVAVVAIVSAVQGQSYCDDQTLRCQARTTRPADCAVRKQACNGSNLWVPECPAAAVERFSPEMIEAVKFSVRQQVSATNNCKVPCNKQYILCDELKATPEEMQDCLIRQQASTNSKKCTWVPMCPT